MTTHAWIGCCVVCRKKLAASEDEVCSRWCRRWRKQDQANRARMAAWGARWDAAEGPRLGVST